MKRSVKKSVAFFAFLAMMVQLFYVNVSVPVNAAEAADFNISEGIVNSYLGTDEDVEIPSDAGIEGVYMWDTSTIKNLTVPEGVKRVSIGDESIEKIIIPSSVESVFLYHCTSLKELEFSGAANGASLDVYSAPQLEKIDLCGSKLTVSLNGVDGIKKLDLSNCETSYADILYCDNLEEVVFNDNTKSISLVGLGALKKAVIPENTQYLNLMDVDFSKITLKDNKYGYLIENGGLYRVDKDGMKSLDAVDFGKKTIDVAEGTVVINALNLSGQYYKIETINLPDSVEKISYDAFYGADRLKKISIPKNCVTLSAYSFGGLSKDIEITIPESVKFVSGDAFVEFKGKLKLEKDTDYLFEYKDGIYRNDYLDNGNKYDQVLVYYPSEKKSISLHPETTGIGYMALTDSQIKTLNLPEGFGFLDIQVSGAYNLTSVTIPKSVYYINTYSLSKAPALKVLKVDAENGNYVSYKNCLYDKEMTTLLTVPATMEKIDIPEGVLSLGYYTVNDHYVTTSADGDYRYVQPVVSLPRSLEGLGTADFTYASFYADTESAKEIIERNALAKEYGEYYGYEPSIIRYTLRDTNKELLNMIYVIDKVTVKKGNKTTISAEMPAGLNSVTELSLGNNTECQVRYKSSNKKVAKVNSKTGKITGVSSGTCTINVKCTINNGKKINTKTLKVKVIVK